ncbi:MAG: hypothetical protein H0U55_14185 [Rubrobacteraceae bacterium]|nr:hypothetical protein [Rubrobacteraceae bacterium]
MTEMRGDFEVHESGCWIWQVSVGANGYGTILDPATGKRVYASREARDGRISEAKKRWWAEKKAAASV